MARILPLNSDAISQIHSSKHITSIQDVVLSLLENSLDAGASKVDITANLRRGGCIVEDNGIGIASAEFQVSGGLGKMYHTSKRGPSEPTHGTSGTYLSSLATLSLLSIISCSEGDEGRSSLLVHQGKVISRQVSPVSAEELSSSAPYRTNITVKDLFGNMPVRVKQRALHLDDHSKEEKSWHELKRGIAALLLAWYRPCVVQLHDAETGRKIVQLSAQHPSTSHALTERSLKNLEGHRTKFDLRDTLPVLLQVGFAQAESRSSWTSVAASSPKVSVKGAINLLPAPTKQCQFLSIGIHPCNTDGALGDPYDAINKVFINSSFGCVEDSGAPLDDQEKDRRKHDRRYKSDGYTQKQLHGKKGVDKWPMFVLQVTLKDQSQPEVTAENVSDSSLLAIVEVLQATVTQWLEAHHFRPRKRGRRKNNDQSGAAGLSSSPQRSSTRLDTPTNIPTPGIKRASTESVTTSKKRKFVDMEGHIRHLDQGRPVSGPAPTTDFSSWSRIKSGRQNFYDQVWQQGRPATAPSDVAEMQTSPMTPPKAAFVLAPLEAGALSKTRDESTTSGKAASPSFPLTRPGVSKTSELWGSSDDYGSIDLEDFTLVAEAVELADPALGADTATTDETVEWTDPVTKQVFRVNARTGVVLPARHEVQPDAATGRAPTGKSARQGAAINMALTSAGQALSLSRRPRTSGKDSGSSWLPGFLKEWDNPTFTRQSEEPIYVASIDGPGLDVTELAGRRCTHHDHAKAFSESGTAGTAKLTKAALKTARVIRQVDRKFLLCQISNAEARSESDLLVLVDQHAASERVILERLFVELCSPADDTATIMARPPRTTLLDKPLRFEVSVAEHELLERQANRFAEWGIMYDLTRRQDSMSASQVRLPKAENLVIVKSLPPAIAERCAHFPNLIIDLLRSEIWSPSSTTKTTISSPEIEKEEHPWLRRLGSCPKGLIELINSRACRSAIMFNDKLSVPECEELLSDLSKCAFPFMCAHGRVSMVPLVDIGGVAHAGRLFAGGAEETGFVQAFSKWQTG
ncbi:DNA mismatch repair protein [Extremus antarcticus]|uniref:DNA mismatch repair protein n=1 Tax=Extremus antarcticus TaxID=702011 RepID=A0AAJ0DJE7_9PEZI|nr:DNA mismatch repair protein [Extremus antarcticus]